MKLYTKFNTNRKLIPVNPLTGLPEYNKAVILKPNDSTEVPDEVAKRLLEQDPHLVSLVPYDELDPQDRWGRTPPGVSEDFGKEKNQFKSLSPEVVTDGSLRKKSKPAPGPLPASMTAGLIPEPAPKPEPITYGSKTEQQRKLEIMHEIAEKGGVVVLTGKQIVHYLKQLGVKSSFDKTLAAQRKVLDNECQRLWETVK